MRGSWSAIGLGVAALVAALSAPRLSERVAPEAAPATPAVATSPPEEAPPAYASHRIHGRVFGGDGADPGEVIIRCADQRWRDHEVDDNGIFAWFVPDGCKLTAYRRFGAFEQEGTSTVVRGGLTDDVVLWVPNHRPAGFGIGLDGSVPGDLRVGEVYRGTPAARAGLQEGDHLLKIDGIDTRDMSAYDFVAHGLGPAGTESTLTVQRADGSLHVVTIRRSEVPRQW